MVTTNADDHPLLRRLHRPDPSRPFDKQDKRAVIPLEIADLPTWLSGSTEEASSLVQLPDPATFLSGPTTPDEPARRIARAEPPGLVLDGLGMRARRRNGSHFQPVSVVGMDLVAVILALGTSCR